MKAIILFTLLAFPFVFYLDSPSYAGEIPCKVSFYPPWQGAGNPLPFTYDADCDLAELKVALFNSRGEYVYSASPLSAAPPAEYDLPDGAYYYVARYRFAGNEQAHKKAGMIVVHSKP